MSQAATPGQATAAPNVQSRTAPIAGRIFATRRGTRKGANVHITILKLPAADEYSAPETVELVSRQKLGERGDEVRCKVQIGGYGRSYQATDPETGEKTTVQTADNTLTVIE